MRLIEGFRPPAGNPRISQANLLLMLERVKARPGMFLRSVDPETAEGFLNGFNLAANAALGWDFDRTGTVRDGAIAKRGWELTPAMGPWHQMKQKGMSNLEVVVEMIEIEMEFVRGMPEFLCAEPGPG